MLAASFVVLMAGGAVADSVDVDSTVAAGETKAPKPTARPSPPPDAGGGRRPGRRGPEFSVHGRACRPGGGVLGGRRRHDHPGGGAERADRTGAARGRRPAPKTGYDRDAFAYRSVDVDRDGCDTRNGILARDLDPETFKPGTGDCIVETGTLADPYWGSAIAFQCGTTTASDVQIHHVVALSDAGQKGARAGTPPS